QTCALPISLTGILTGAVGSYFHLSINYLLLWPQRLSAYFSGIELVAIAAFITMVCTVLAAFLVRRLAPEASGSGVQEIEGAMEGLRVVRWRRILPVKLTLGVVALSSGLVL